MPRRLPRTNLKPRRSPGSIGLTAIAERIEMVRQHQYPGRGTGAWNRIGMPAKGNEVTAARIQIGSQSPCTHTHRIRWFARKICAGVSIDPQRLDAFEHLALIAP